jgi:hypothetical protein
MEDIEHAYEAVFAKHAAEILRLGGKTVSDRLSEVARQKFLQVVRPSNKVFNLFPYRDFPSRDQYDFVDNFISIVFHVVVVLVTISFLYLSYEQIKINMFLSKVEKDLISSIQIVNNLKTDIGENERWLKEKQK